MAVSETGPAHTSRIAGFYKRSVRDRLRVIHETGVLSEESLEHLKSGGGIPSDVADLMSENVVSTHGLPFSIALNFRINERDVLVPMAVEEPSVVAAASNAARLLRIAGGFKAVSTSPVMTTQVQLDRVPDTERVPELIDAHRQEILDAGNAAIPGMVQRGGGCEDLDVRVLDAEEGMVVVHVYVNVGDAMGANLVDTVAEATAPVVQRVVGGQVGLRILSNLPLRRMVSAEARVSADAIGGDELADGIARASRFAELDPFRAVTHNKGVMNGIDSVAVALGQDWRSLEAAAHAYAALDRPYGPIATWKRSDSGLVGRIELPMAVGTVGGSTRVHAGVRAAFELVGVRSAQELAQVVACAGLASNLAALKALAGEGIQQGHMRLHARKSSRPPAAAGER